MEEDERIEEEEAEEAERGGVDAGDGVAEAESGDDGAGWCSGGESDGLRRREARSRGCGSVMSPALQRCGGNGTV